jgi:hypothetical protein
VQLKAMIVLIAERGLHLTVVKTVVSMSSIAQVYAKGVSVNGVYCRGVCEESANSTGRFPTVRDADALIALATLMRDSSLA